MADPAAERHARLPRHGGARREARGDQAGAAVADLDAYYEDQLGASGRRIATQLAKQLAEPAPYDLSNVDLREYRHLEKRWQDWDNVARACEALAVAMLDRLSEESA